MNPLPYTIRDMMLDERLSRFIRTLNLPKAQALEARESEFKQIFGIDLVFFINPLAGFDYVKFTKTVLDPVLNGVSYNMATASRFGARAAELIGELIHAG